MPNAFLTNKYVILILLIIDGFVKILKALDDMLAILFKIVLEDRKARKTGNASETVVQRRE